MFYSFFNLSNATNTIFAWSKAIPFDSIISYLSSESSPKYFDCFSIVADSVLVSDSSSRLNFSVLKLGLQYSTFSPSCERRTRKNWASIASSPNCSMTLFLSIRLWIHLHLTNQKQPIRRARLLFTTSTIAHFLHRGYCLVSHSRSMWLTNHSGIQRLQGIMAMNNLTWLYKM